MGLFNSEYTDPSLYHWYDESTRHYEFLLKRAAKKRDDETITVFFNSRQFRQTIDSILIALERLKVGPNKEYYRLINETKGDYSKRKTGNIYDRLRYTVSYMEEQGSLDDPGNVLHHTFINTFTQIFHILEDPQWKRTFMTAYDHCSRYSEKSIAISYKVFYIALVISFETIATMVLDFQVLNESGIGSKKRLIDIMNKKKALMENLVKPAIDLVCLCHLTKNPEIELNKMLNDELKTRDFTRSRESFSIEPTERLYSSEGIIGDIRDLLFENDGRMTRLTKGLLLVASVALGMYICLNFFPAMRYIIYYIATLKVNKEKETEIVAEILGNNILRLKREMDEETNPTKKAFKKKVIEKQLELYNHMQKEIRFYHQNSEFVVNQDVLELMKKDESKVLAVKPSTPQSKPALQTITQPTKPSVAVSKPVIDDEPVFDMDI